MPVRPILSGGVALCGRENCPEWQGQLGLDLAGMSTSAGMGCRLMSFQQTGDGSCEPYYSSHLDRDLFPESAGIWERLEAAENIAAMRVRARQ